MAKLWPRGFRKTNRGRWWAIVEAHNIGGSLAPLLTNISPLAVAGKWFYVPGAISLLMGIVALFAIKDPGTLGFAQRWGGGVTTRRNWRGQGQPGQPELLANFCEIYPGNPGMDHYYR